ncbi:MAG: hypothetical protein K9N47_23040 [Prosthecobacter sp.]|nr:hypothetical protein [Prosthecobacter sp.]
MGDDHLDGADCCPVCLAAVPEGSVFCPACRTSVNTVSSPIPFDRTDFRKAATDPENPKMIILVTAWVLFGMLFLLGCLDLLMSLNASAPQPVRLNFSRDFDFTYTPWPGWRILRSLLLVLGSGYALLYTTKRFLNRPHQKAESSSDD